MSYIDYPIKCQGCGLHYTVHSWSDDWYSINEDGRSRTNGGFCPECGKLGGKLLFASEAKDEQIFQVVGHTQIQEITAAVAQGIGHGAATLKRAEEEGA